jgi:KUP system potassium uptake protein
VVNKNVGTDIVVGVSCAILVLLFILQPLGIHRLGSAFAPIVMIWLLFNLVFGIYVSAALRLHKNTELMQI